MDNGKSVKNEESAINILTANGHMVYIYSRVPRTHISKWVPSFFYKKRKAVSSFIYQRSFLLVICNPPKP